MRTLAFQRSWVDLARQVRHDRAPSQMRTYLAKTVQGAPGEIGPAAFECASSQVEERIQTVTCAGGTDRVTTSTRSDWTLSRSISLRNATVNAAMMASAS